MEEIYCPLCHSISKLKWPGTEHWFLTEVGTYSCTTSNRSRPEIWECLQCEHVFSNPMHWPADLGSEYNNVVDKDYIDLFQAKEKTFNRTTKIVKKYTKPGGSVLEVGSYTGQSLRKIVLSGFKGTGIEPSNWASTIARNLGLTVVHGTAEIEIPKLDRTFDGVVSWDVIEHVKDPQIFINLLSAKTKAGGFIFISTMDRAHWFAKFLGPRWPWVIPMHLHYFDKSGLQKMGEKAGLDLIKTGNHVHFTNPGYSLSRLLGSSQDSWPRWLVQLTKYPIFPVALGDIKYFVYKKT